MSPAALTATVISPGTLAPPAGSAPASPLGEPTAFGRELQRAAEYGIDEADPGALALQAEAAHTPSLTDPTRFERKPALLAYAHPVGVAGGPRMPAEPGIFDTADVQPAVVPLDEAAEPVDDLAQGADTDSALPVDLSAFVASLGVFRSAAPPEAAAAASGQRDLRAGDDKATPELRVVAPGIDPVAAAGQRDTLPSVPAERAGAAPQAHAAHGPVNSPTAKTGEAAKAFRPTVAEVMSATSDAAATSTPSATSATSAMSATSATSAMSAAAETSAMSTLSAASAISTTSAPAATPAVRPQDTGTTDMLIPVASGSGTARSETTSAALTFAPVVAEDSLTPRVDSDEFAQALGARVAVFARNGVEHARLNIHPAEMGPIALQLALDGTQLRVDMSADMAATRRALEQALPALASALSEAGLTLSGGGVFQQAREGAGDARPGGMARDANGRVPDTATTSAGGETGGPTLLTRPVRLDGLVDLYA